MPCREFLDGASDGFEVDGTLANHAMMLNESSFQSNNSNNSLAGDVLALPLMATSLAVLLST